MSRTRASLVAEVSSGNASSSCWREFVNEYRPLLMRLVRRAGAAAADVEDIVQDVLIRLTRVLPAGGYQNGRGRFRSWLARVAANAATDRRRKRERLIFNCDREPVDEHAPGAGPVADPERVALLHDALRAVQRDCRVATWRCFSAHILEGRPADEVARRVGVSENAVYVNSHRVQAKVKEQCRRLEKGRLHGRIGMSR